MSTFVCSDLHLGHSEIIRFASRPFKSVHEMDIALVNAWNKTVKPMDKVYFLGDLARLNYTEYWIPKLNGDITFIRGNHDRFTGTYYYDNYILKYKGTRFYLTHYPEEIPYDWDGYAIHGHKHNKNVNKYPFFSPETKRFNVSCELTRYRPISMDYILRCTK